MVEVNHSAPYAKVAVEFARALVDGDFDGAHAKLCSGFRQAVSASRLRKNYGEMVEYGEAPADSVELITTMEEWPDKKANDLGWAYVAICGDGYSEAVTVILEEENGQPAIRELEWGRP